jgi:hypothetical protein
MTCIRLQDRVGDRGQRYEIRYFKLPEDVNTKPTEEKVFGWAGDAAGAEKMRAACALAPWCYLSWVVDREPTPSGPLAA